MSGNSTKTHEKLTELDEILLEMESYRSWLQKELDACDKRLQSMRRFKKLYDRGRMSMLILDR